MTTKPPYSVYFNAYTNQHRRKENVNIKNPKSLSKRNGKYVIPLGMNINLFQAKQTILHRHCEKDGAKSINSAFISNHVSHFTYIGLRSFSFAIT